MIDIGVQSDAGATRGKSAILLGMTLALDDLPDDVAALKALLLVAKAENATLASENLRFKTQNERYAHILRVLRRAHFGRSSEKISDDQLNLALDDVQTGFAAENAKAEKANDSVEREATKARRANRGHLPAHLPREEIVIEPDVKACPCCGGTLHQIGEDRSERLDKVPAKLRVLVTRRPKYACRSCEKTGADSADAGGHPERPFRVAGVIQAPAPARLIEGGIPTEALVADVLVSKYADHQPLYRQSQGFARDGVIIDRSTLCHWAGFGAAELEPLHARLIQHLMRSTKLFCDETRCPVLDPGRGKTKTGYLWAVARDDRPWGGSDPPAVAYHYAPGRGGEHARTLFAGFNGVLQVDGYDGYNGLADTARPGGAITLAYCWSHFRRRFYDLAKGGNAPVASAALDKIGALYGIEAEVRGQSGDTRRAVRQERTRPLVDALKTWLSEQLAKLPRSSETAEAIRYGLNHWSGLACFLVMLEACLRHDGRIEIDSNTVERSIRGIAMSESFCTPFVSVWKH